MDLNILNWVILTCKRQYNTRINQKGKDVNYCETVFISKLNLKKEVVQLGNNIGFSFRLMMEAVQVTKHH